MIVSAKGLCKDYGTASVLKQVDLEIERGLIYGVVGPSGSGKSTLLGCLAGLLEPSSGVLSLGCQKVGVVFQAYTLLSRRNAWQNVVLPLELRGCDRASLFEKGSKCLDMVGLVDQAFLYPSQLSGGQKQRVAIARAVAYDAELLICDECTSALDPVATCGIIDLLKRLNRERKITVVISTHSISVVEKACDRVVFMDHGQVLDSGETPRLLSSYRRYYGECGM